MIRLFEQHMVRPQKELEGMWDFIREDGEEYRLPVPGCWEQDFRNVSAWNVKEPNLYLLSARLIRDGKCLDDMIERVGFRRVECKDRKLCINGEKVFLKGFNRHEDYGVIGCAISPQLMAQDMDLMQDMGANAVRTCHYPNDERFL